jgi:sRNA-binding protein
MTTDELMALVDDHCGVYRWSTSDRIAESRAALRSALEQVVADSDRYRWLCTDPDASFFDFEGKCCRHEPKAEIDEAIDQARKATNANT